MTVMATLIGVPRRIATLGAHRLKLISDVSGNGDEPFSFALDAGSKATA
jgi:hypothetical protein